VLFAFIACLWFIGPQANKKDSTPQQWASVMTIMNLNSSSVFPDELFAAQTLSRIIRLVSKSKNVLLAPSVMAYRDSWFRSHEVGCLTRKDRNVHDL
jgi:hypothetical protein